MKHLLWRRMRPMRRLYAPHWWAILFGGDYHDRHGGIGHRPNLYRHVRRYYAQDWSAAGYTLTDWIFLRGKRPLRQWMKERHL